MAIIDRDIDNGTNPQDMGDARITHQEPGKVVVTKTLISQDALAAIAARGTLIPENNEVVGTPETRYLRNVGVSGKGEKTRMAAALESALAKNSNEVQYVNGIAILEGTQTVTVNVTPEVAEESTTPATMEVMHGTTPPIPEAPVAVEPTIATLEAAAASAETLEEIEATIAAAEQAYAKAMLKLAEQRAILAREALEAHLKKTVTVGEFFSAKARQVLKSFKQRASYVKTLAVKTYRQVKEYVVMTYKKAKTAVRIFVDNLTTSKEILNTPKTVFLADAQKSLHDASGHFQKGLSTFFDAMNKRTNVHRLPV